MKYGNELCHCVSAQVVPNDLEVSKAEGKKVFAFSDMILKMHRDKPFTKLGTALYGKDYVDSRRRFLFNETEMWHKIYDLETVGHEFGHTLWIDDATEVAMNKSGEFKNIEEFKATTGGIISLFYEEEDYNKTVEEFLRSTTERAIGLSIWRNEESGLPYYCEGMIHLTGLFETGVISFDGDRIAINIKDNYEKIKEWYLKTYEDLARHYLEKKDAGDFLGRHVEIVDGVYLHKDKEILEFCNYVIEKFKALGSQVDESVKKEDYLLK